MCVCVSNIIVAYSLIFVNNEVKIPIADNTCALYKVLNFLVAVESKLHSAPLLLLLHGQTNSVQNQISRLLRFPVASMRLISVSGAFTCVQFRFSITIPPDIVYSSISRGILSLPVFSGTAQGESFVLFSMGPFCTSSILPGPLMPPEVFPTLSFLYGIHSAPATVNDWPRKITPSQTAQFLAVSGFPPSRPAGRSGI